MNCNQLRNLIFGMLAFAAIGLHERRPWWPSAATCAFLTSGLTILPLVPLQWQLNYTYIWLGFWTCSESLVKATALWGVGRRRLLRRPVRIDSARTLVNYCLLIYCLPQADFRR
jgi:hypothetical protein